MGNVPTDKLFTGQRLDGTGLYFYNARYYDPTIGRFISPDTIVPYPNDPQSFNRYSYCRNNPLKYVDPSGHDHMMDAYYMFMDAGRALAKANEVRAEYIQLGIYDTALFSAAYNQTVIDKVVAKYSASKGEITKSQVVEHSFIPAIALPLGFGATEAFAAAGSLTGVFPGLLVGGIFVGTAYAAVEGPEYIASTLSFEEAALAYNGMGGAYLLARSQEKAVKSLITVIQDHEGKISDNPGDPGRNDWEKHIKKALDNIKKELNKMGPVAKQRALEMLERAGIHLP